MNVNGYVPKNKTECNNLLSLEKTSTEDLFELLHASRDFARKRTAGEKCDVLRGKYVALVTKHSFFRTRIAFQIATQNVGGNAMVLPLSGSSLEDYLKDRDAVNAIKGYGVAGFVVDTSVSRDAEIMDNYSTLPIINANSRTSPCQTLASLLTIWQRKEKLHDLKIAVIGDLREADCSLLYGAAKCGMDVNVVCPEYAEPPANAADYCRQFCDVEIFNDLEDGLTGADVIYIMSHDFDLSFEIDERSLRYAKNNAVILHPLPVRRDCEIAETLLDSPNCLINEQSANLLPVLEAVESLIIGK